MVVLVIAHCRGVCRPVTNTGDCDVQYARVANRVEIPLALSTYINSAFTVAQPQRNYANSFLF